MTRNYNRHLGGMDYYQSRPNNPPSLAISGANLEDYRSYSGGRHEDRTSPSHDEDPERGTRRRIAVACARCRKRKIKCSGDTGNGQGCQNCKSAGQERCEFLRVSSHPMEPAAWPYVSRSPSFASAQIHAGWASNPSSGNTTQPPMPSGSWPGSGICARMNSGTTFTTNTWGPAGPRQLYPANYEPSYRETYSESYGMHAPQYSLPSSETQVPMPNVACHEWPRNWTPHGASGRSPQIGGYLDQDVPMRANSSSTYPFIGPSSQNLIVDGSSQFPGMSSLATSLPNADRMLPNPTPKKASTASAGMVDQVLSNMTSSGPIAQSQGTNFGSVPWGPERVTSGGSHGSTTNTTITASSVVDTTGIKPPSPASIGQDTQPFGYLSISHSPPSLGANGPSDYSLHSVPTSVPGIENYPGPASTSFTGGSSNDTLLPGQNSSSNLYGYTLGSNSRRDSAAESQGSDGLLSNGQRYSRLRQGPTPSQTAFDNFRRNSTEEQSRLAHKASIPNIGSNRLR